MIQTSTLKFLKELAGNNNREWFVNNKEAYNQARENILNTTAVIIEGLSKSDASFPAHLNPAECVMRIYRDIRFSKDKTPYKTNFGIAISPNGKNFNGPGFYIHIEPSKSFVAGGSWYPQNEQLKAIRQEIDYNGEEFLKIINTADFVKAFGPLDQEGKLKSPPKGYQADNEMIEYLKLKSFVAIAALNDKQLQQNDFVAEVLQTFNKLNPLMIFLRKAIS